jgi:hypothetical protein
MAQVGAKMSCAGFFLVFRLGFLYVYRNPVYFRLKGVSAYSLSLYRHPSTYSLFTSRFTSYNQQLFFFRNRNVHERDSGRLMPSSVSDSIVEFTPAPTPCSRSSLSPPHNIHTPYCLFYPHKPVYRSLDPSAVSFSLPLYRHPSICILFNSHITTPTNTVERERERESASPPAPTRPTSRVRL